MEFIHAVVYTQDEMKYGDYDTGSWDDLNNGDYIVHCLYCESTEDLIVLEDNTHAPVEQIISSFLDGVRYVYDEITVKKAFIIVDNGLSYNKEAVGLCLVEGNYVEVKD